MSPRRSTSTGRQRQQWRERKAAERERKKKRNPATRLLDQSHFYGTWLMDSEADDLIKPSLSLMTAKHGRDEEPLPRREYRELVEKVLAERIKERILKK
jgi:hypothetical protein